MRSEFVLPAGGAQSGVLRLVNESEATRVQAEILDFNFDAEQTPQFGPSLPSEASFSCNKWLTINPMEAELQVMGEVPVRYTIRVPASATPRTYYCAVGFTSLPTADKIKGMGMRSAVRIISAFYVNVGKEPVDGQLKNIALERVNGGKGFRAVVTLENRGKSYFRPTGSVEVLDSTGAPLETFEVNPIPVLPERQQRLLFPLSKFTEGQPCKIHVRIDIGGEVQEGNAEILAEAIPK
jgi:hypothetical protein